MRRRRYGELELSALKAAEDFPRASATFSSHACNPFETAHGPTARVWIASKQCRGAKQCKPANACAHGSKLGAEPALTRSERIKKMAAPLSNAPLITDDKAAGYRFGRLKLLRALCAYGTLSTFRHASRELA